MRTMSEPLTAEDRLRYAISTMKAAVYGEDDVPKWFTDRLDDVIDAAREGPGLDEPKGVEGIDWMYLNGDSIHRLLFDLGHYDNGCGTAVAQQREEAGE